MNATSLLIGGLALFLTPVMVWSQCEDAARAVETAQREQRAAERAADTAKDSLDNAERILDLIGGSGAEAALKIAQGVADAALDALRDAEELLAQAEAELEGCEEESSNNIDPEPGGQGTELEQPTVGFDFNLPDILINAQAPMEMTYQLQHSRDLETWADLGVTHSPGSNEEISWHVSTAPATERDRGSTVLRPSTGLPRGADDASGNSRLYFRIVYALADDEGRQRPNRHR